MSNVSRAMTTTKIFMSVMPNQSRLQIIKFRIFTRSSIKRRKIEMKQIDIVLTISRQATSEDKSTCLVCLMKICFARAGVLFPFSNTMVIHGVRSLPVKIPMMKCISISVTVENAFEHYQL